MGARGGGEGTMHSLSDSSCVPFMDKQRTVHFLLCLQNNLCVVIIIFVFSEVKYYTHISRISTVANSLL